MEYKIIRAVAEIGQIEVEYSHAGKVAGVYAIDVPVVDGAFLTGDALDAEIRLRAPTWAVQREAEVATATGFDLITSLVNSSDESTQTDPEAQANADMWQKTEFEKQVADVLVKYGLLESNPVSISMTVS